MADEPKKGLFGISNPFTKKANAPQPIAFSEPQPGDPNYKAPPPSTKSPFDPPMKKKKPEEESEDSGAEAAAKPAAGAKETKAAGPTTVAPKTASGSSLPVASGEGDVAEQKRGLELLRDDLLKSAPEAVGVGRQDVTTISTPQFGDPGYKYQAYETVNVSELGISPFPDDANAVDKVGGIEAVKKAARAAKKGQSAEVLKAKALKKEVKVVEEQVFDIPDYLKPLPEDTPRKGLTWKNYNGR